MEIRIEPFCPADLPEITAIWNEVVESGNAFPQEMPLTPEEAGDFFAAQDVTGVARVGDDIAGLYILHPNHVGRCGHQANASFAVRSNFRGLHIGEALVRHCLAAAKTLGYRLLIFNAVVKDNHAAVTLYEKLGFVKIGEVPGAFHAKDGSWRDTILFYKNL